MTDNAIVLEYFARAFGGADFTTLASNICASA